MNPVHAGHCEYISLAREFAGDDGAVICIVNSDHQARLKRGFTFVPERDRLAVMGAMRAVDFAVLSVDADRTVRRTLAVLCGSDSGMSAAELCTVPRLQHMRVPPRPTHFVNGGDVTQSCAEEQTCRELGVELVYGLGDKVQSSSWILGDSVRMAHAVMFPTVSVGVGPDV
jgi:glycerol-3-phosphate cytidylyltransferase-like family protein